MSSRGKALIGCAPLVAAWLLIGTGTPAAAQASCAQSAATLTIPVSPDGATSRAALSWPLAPSGLRVAASVSISDSSNRVIPGARAEWFDDIQAPGAAMVRLQFDRTRVPLAGLKRADVTWRDEQGVPHTACSFFRLQSVPPDSATVRWLLPSGLSGEMDGSGAVSNPDRPKLRVSAAGLWTDTRVEVEAALSRRLDLSAAPSLTATAGADVADFDVRLLTPTLPAGRFSASLMNDGWAKGGIRLPALTISGAAPTLSQPNTVTREYNLPADVPRADLSLAGSNFAPPLVAEVAALAADGTRLQVQTFTISDPPEQCSPTDNVQCIRLSFDHFGKGSAAAYAIRVKNFDGRWSPEPVTARVRSDVFAIARVETSLADRTSAIVGVPTQLKLLVPADKQLPATSSPLVVRLNGTGVSLRGLPQADGSILVPEVRFEDPGGDSDPFTVSVTLEYPGGAIGQGAVRVLRRTDVRGPVVIYGEASQSVRLPGRYLEGADVTSGVSTTVLGVRSEGSVLTLSLSNPTRGASEDTLAVLRAGTRVGFLPVEIRRRPVLAKAAGLTVGSPGTGDGACPSPAESDLLTREIVASPDAVVCVQVRPGSPDLNAAVSDSVTVALLQDGKVIGAVKSAGFAARSGSRSIALPLIGAQDGTPVIVHVERPNGEAADGRVMLKVRERFGPFASITAASIQLGLSRAQQAVDERRLSQVFNPQIGIWMNPISTSKDVRVFGSILTLRRSYCASTSQDVPAWSVGALIGSLVTVGVGHAIGSTPLPRTCSGSADANASTTVRDGGRFFLVVGGGIVVGR